MPEDRYRALRELPFPVAAQALGIDVSKFRQRKNGSEWSGPCPVHCGERSNTAFSYSAEAIVGRLNIPQTDKVLTWSTVVPRISAVCQLTSDRRTVLNAAYGRFHGEMDPSLDTDFIHPNGVRRWQSGVPADEPSRGSAKGSLDLHTAREENVRQLVALASDTRGAVPAKL